MHLNTISVQMHFSAASPKG
jgi:hypothetical protein